MWKLPLVFYRKLQKSLINGNFKRKISKIKYLINELYVSPLPRYCDSEIAKHRSRSRGKEEFGKGATRWKEVFRLS